MPPVAFVCAVPAGKWKLGAAAAKTAPVGFLGLLGFLWSLRSGQYEDLDGAAWRALEDTDPAPDSQDSRR